MKEKINQEQRAFSTWTILTKCSMKNETITYGELASKLNLHHRAIRFILGVIQDYCMENALPPLTIIVLNKGTGLPGDGFIAYDIENSQDGINKVFAFNWSMLENPFEYAKIGITENKLIEEIIDNPENSSDVFAKIKVRGIAQRIFRKALLEIYQNSCAICGLSFTEALEASHIIPYSHSNYKQRLDVRNGILLCSTHHKLFDKGIITINQDYSICHIETKENLQKYSDFDKLMTVSFNRKTMNLPDNEKHKPNKYFLLEHQNNK